MAREAAGPPPLRAASETDSPSRLKYVEPEFPSNLRRPEAFGTVAFDILVGSNGKVRLIRITQSVPLIDDVITQAATQWEYKPMILAGQSVPVIVPYRYSWAGDAVPAEVLAQLGGTGRFEDQTVLSGTYKNSSSWTIGWIESVFRGPKDKLMPVKWERHCQTSGVILPGQDKEFRCQMDAVDLSADWRWEIKAASGLPGN
jgi:hypothetical protein